MSSDIKNWYLCAQCGWKGTDNDKVERPGKDDAQLSVLACPSCDNESFFFSDPPSETAPKTPKSDLVVLQEMAAANEDISVSNQMYDARLSGRNGLIRMWVEPQIIVNLLSDGYAVALYVVNKEQFLKRKNS